MANQYSPLETADRLRGLKIRVLFDPNHGAADDSGAPNASGDPQHHDDLEEPRSHDRHDGEQEEQSREGHPGIDKTLHRQVHFPPKESGRAANQDGDDHIECSRCQTDGQGDLSSIEKAAEQVSPQVIGPQEVLRGWRLQYVCQVYFPIGIRSQPLGKNCDENQDQDENPAGRAQGLLLPQPDEEISQPAPPPGFTHTLPSGPNRDRSGR